MIGYSLGANATAFVANKTKYIDLVVALQPSMLSWNPPITGKVGRFIEIYNPSPWMTFGGMGSKKLEGPNIEYIANNDSHPGAQFNSDFRDLVKRELANFAAEDREERQDSLETAQAAPPSPPSSSIPVALAQPAPSTKLGFAEEQPTDLQKDAVAKAQNQMAQIEIPLPRPRPDRVAQELPELEPTKPAPKESVAFIDTQSNSVVSGDLSSTRELTLADMTGYAQRTYGVSPAAGNSAANSQR